MALGLATPGCHTTRVAITSPRNAFQTIEDGTFTATPLRKEERILFPAGGFGARNPGLNFGPQVLSSAFARMKVLKAGAVLTKTSG